MTGPWAGRSSAAVASNALHSENLVASIPHREALLLFAKGDVAYRDAMRALVREKESDRKKPLTFGLFELTDHGPTPLVE